jgi:hypothetical protein
MNGKARARLLALGLKYQSAKEGLSCRGLGTVFGLSASEQMIWFVTILAFLGTVVAAMLVFLFFPERADSNSTKKAGTAAKGSSDSDKTWVGALRSR